MKVGRDQGKPGAPRFNKAIGKFMNPLRLGLVGDNIAQSQSPLLHTTAGAQHGLQVSYDRLVPAQQNANFDKIFAKCQSSGYRGINITYPYKEVATDLVATDDPLVKAIGAVNTVLFEQDGPKGFNTDFTGFMAAYRSARPQLKPGSVFQIGCGGVGRAVAFALAALGAEKLVLFDRDLSKAENLKQSLRHADLDVVIANDAVAAAHGVTGLVNCTPVGMVGLEGSPIPKAAMANAQWAFDAVYTPERTQFLSDAAQMGLALISGWELFFHQGIQAWALFSERPVEPKQIRAELRESGDLQ